MQIKAGVPDSLGFKWQVLNSVGSSLAMQEDASAPRRRQKSDEATIGRDYP